MATEQQIDVYNLPANADLSASQYCGVVINSSGKIAVAGAGARIDGVLQNKPTANDAAVVAYNGVSKGVAGAAFAAGADLMTNASGQFVTATTGNAIVARATEAATAANNIVGILVQPAAKNMP